MTAVVAPARAKYLVGDYVEVAQPLCWPFVSGAVARIAALLPEADGVYYRLVIGRRQLIVAEPSLGFLQLALPGFADVAASCGGAAEYSLERVGGVQQLLDDAQQIVDVQGLAQERAVEVVQRRDPGAGR